MTYDFYKSPCLCSVFSNASGEDKHVSQYVCAVLATGRIRNERAFLHMMLLLQFSSINLLSYVHNITHISSTNIHKNNIPHKYLIQFYEHNYLFICLWFCVHYLFMNIGTVIKRMIPQKSSI